MRRSIAPPYTPRDKFEMTELSPILSKEGITESNAQSSRLLRLPAELRTKIFAHTLGGHEMRFSWQDKGCKRPSKRIFGIRRRSDNSALMREERKMLLNITLISRQIYTETGLLPFAVNTFPFTMLPDAEQEKWFAQKLLVAQQNAITTVRCPVQKMFFEFEAGPVASRHCTGTFKQLGSLQCLVLEAENFQLSREEKEIVVKKIRTVNGKDMLKVVFLDGKI
ncbi:hypothetical protein CC86DRAFT_282473 [Ophiobolus disseminans]|uniref:Uncharacterized protein n=1 Tax=Ophiobolus disseminans TaxID=1469910 RepID=A0A6A7AE52_9PLEO|nr:hypothetical protein CC86DRAFT_282473 [Ophiobolus disseminans]